ncbi:MAG: hypothetical protein BM556_13100 [Bacteriovorax sp. MedPE-SWde]|nr:MAG: hypothetical protein BM556_13100 [Bacteriovorax sp. MedPE-SWde]
MKFSCEHNEIEYIIETEAGHQTDAKYHFMLSSEERKKLGSGGMGYYHVNITATKDDSQLVFILQGIPLSNEAEEQVEDVEDFFESLTIFEKVEHMFSLENRKEAYPHWGTEDAKPYSETK